MTSVTSVMSFWCFCCYLWTYFTPFSFVSIVNFEQVKVSWDKLNGAKRSIKTSKLEQGVHDIMFEKEVAEKNKGYYLLIEGGNQMQRM